MNHLQCVRSKYRSQLSGVYPLGLPALRHGFDLTFDRNVSFFVGENGSGKSTLLEAMAEHCGFHANGGGRDPHRALFAERSALAEALYVGCNPRGVEGFFLRAETFFNFATQMEGECKTFREFGGRSLLAQSHGESFLALFQNRFESGIYLLDEPEAALSPQRQLALLRIIQELETSYGAQFIIATHSPILLAYPGAKLYEFHPTKGIKETRYQDTEHYRVTKQFLDDTDRSLRNLFAKWGGVPGDD